MNIATNFIVKLVLTRSHRTPVNFLSEKGLLFCFRLALRPTTKILTRFLVTELTLGLHATWPPALLQEYLKGMAKVCASLLEG